MAEAIIEDSTGKVKALNEPTEEQAPQACSDESPNNATIQEGETTDNNSVSKYIVCSEEEDEDEDEDDDEEESKLSSKEDTEASEKELAQTRGAEAMATTTTLPSKPAGQALDDEKDVDESDEQELRPQHLDHEKRPNEEKDVDESDEQKLGRQYLDHERAPSEKDVDESDEQELSRQHLDHEKRPNEEKDVDESDEQKLGRQQLDPEKRPSEKDVDESDEQELSCQHLDYERLPSEKDVDDSDKQELSRQHLDHEKRPNEEKDVDESDEQELRRQQLGPEKRPSEKDVDKSDEQELSRPHLDYERLPSEKDVNESDEQGELRRQNLDSERRPSSNHSFQEEQVISDMQDSDEMRQTNGATAAEVPSPNSTIHQTTGTKSAPYPIIERPVSEPPRFRQSIPPPPIPVPIGDVTIESAAQVQYGDTYIVDPAKKTKKKKNRRDPRATDSQDPRVFYNLEGHYHEIPRRTPSKKPFDERDLDKLLAILDSKKKKLEGDITACKKSLADQKELLGEFFAGEQGPPTATGASLNHGQSAGASAATSRDPSEKVSEKTNSNSENPTGATPAAEAGKEPTEESTRSQENGNSKNATSSAKTATPSTSEPSIFKTPEESTSEPSIFVTSGDVRPKTSGHRDPLENPSGGTATTHTDSKGKSKYTTEGAKKKEPKRSSSPPVKEMAVQSGIGHMQTVEALHHNHVTGLTYIPKFDCICFTQFDHPMLYIFCERTQTMEWHRIPELVNPSGMTSLDGQEDRLAMSDFSHSRLHLVSVKAIEGHKLVIDRESHVIWKLAFKPADVSRFVDEMLLLSSMGDGTINIFSYDGVQVGSVFIKGVPVERLYSAAMVDRRTFVAVDNGEKGALHWVSGTGEVSRSYRGKEEGMTLSQPIQVILDHEGRYIIADQNNNCVHLLDVDGKFERTLLQRGDALILPRRLYMDTSQRRPRLFVGCGSLHAIEIRIYDYENLCSSGFDTSFGRAMSRFDEEEDPSAETLDNHEPRVYAATASPETTLSETTCDDSSVPNRGSMSNPSWLKVSMQCGLAFVLSTGAVIVGFYVIRYLPKSWKSKYLPLL